MATPLSWWAGARERARAQSMQDFLTRAILAALAVVVCYQFRWDGLRFLTSELNLRLDALLGVHLQRLTFDTVLWRGQVYTYLIACTFADVWCGAIPFLWTLRRTVAENLLALAGFTLALFALNIGRLSLSDFLCAHGASWNLGHNALGGVCYFLVWTWLQHYRHGYADVAPGNGLEQPSPGGGEA